MTANSVVSISLTPPIIMFAVKDPSQFGSLLKLAAAGSESTQPKFIINLLDCTQSRIAADFADSGKQGNFSDAGTWCMHATLGIPMLKSEPGSAGLGSVVCGVHQVVSMGDHALWFGRVLEVEMVPGAGRAPALVYGHGGYGSFQVASSVFSWVDFVIAW
jgi:flavin reductase (DIM6/NTAB) family NADH-FMN oxidoreductase RutF